MLINTSKILPLLTKLSFQTGSSKQKFSYTDCLLLSALFKRNLIRFWVACRLLNASFIFNGIEYAKLRLYLCFYKFDLFAGRRFWTLFFPKKYTSAYT